MTFSFGCDCYNCEFVEAQIVFTPQPAEVQVRLVRKLNCYDVLLLCEAHMNILQYYCELNYSITLQVCLLSLYFSRKEFHR